MEIKNQSKKKKKEEWRKSSPVNTMTESFIELGELCTQAMANKQGIKQKHEEYLCWICSSDVEDGTPGICCKKCGAWVHARCVNVSYKVIDDINKGKGISIVVYCDSCGSNDKHQKEMLKEIREIKHKLETQDDVMRRQNDVIHKLTGNIDNLVRDMKLMTAEMKQIKDENKKLKKIYSELRDENNNAKSKMPATNAQTLSCANAAKNALIVKTADSGNLTEKRAKIVEAFSDVPIDKTRETTNGALIMNIKDKANMEKAKNAIDDVDNIEKTTKIGNTYVSKIMLTYVSVTNEDDDDDDGNDVVDNSRDRFKVRIIEGLKRKK